MKGHRDGVGRGSKLFSDFGIVEAFEVPERKDFSAPTANRRECPPELLLELTAMVPPIGGGCGVRLHVAAGDFKRHAVTGVPRLDDVEGSVGRGPARRIVSSWSVQIDSFTGEP